MVPNGWAILEQSTQPQLSFQMTTDSADKLTASLGDPEPEQSS